MSSKPDAKSFPDLAAPPRKPKKNAAPSSGRNDAAGREKPKRRPPLFGLVTRKEKWVLSTRGRLLTLAALLIFAWAFVAWVHPFLAVTDRVDAEYLVVEGWVPNYALEESIAEFKTGPYKMIFTVGADPLTGTNIEPHDSIAIESYKRLKWLGMNPDLIKPVPAHIKYRNRTFESAVALRKWIEENHVPVTSFNLVTLGPHARRSRLLFEEAFRGQARVGIISVEDREYDPKRWWKYSEGVKEVISEGVGYLYARFLFHPGKE
jgi:hypothetical protein